MLFRSVLQYSTDALDAVKAAMPKAFGVLPKADVLVKPYPEFAESGSGEYHSSSEDGTRPGIFYIAVTDPTGRSRSNQRATLHHETFPGHHLQGAIALELGNQQHPLARYLWNSGYGEGWALYSERLADELGLYPTPLDRIGLYNQSLVIVGNRGYKNPSIGYSRNDMTRSTNSSGSSTYGVCPHPDILKNLQSCIVDTKSSAYFIGITGSSSPQIINEGTVIF